MELMNGLIVYVNWEYFLGIMGALIGIAYYTNGRFTSLETSVEWIKEALRALKIMSDNAQNRHSKRARVAKRTKAPHTLEL